MLILSIPATNNVFGGIENMKSLFDDYDVFVLKNNNVANCEHIERIDIDNVDEFILKNGSNGYSIVKQFNKSDSKNFCIPSGSRFFEYHPI